MSHRSKAVVAAAIAGLMGLAYFAGAAQAGASETVTKLNQSYDLLTKARAVLGSISTRAGYSNVESAKSHVDAALAGIQKAVAANGG